MFSTTKQCSCKLIFQLQHKLKQVSKHASRACSLKVKQVLSDPLEYRKYEHENEQYDETDSEITFRFKDLTTKLCDPDQLRTKPDVTDLKFGHIFTDHMLKVFYHKKLGGWQKPVIIPFENISLHPAAKVLHYAVELFEGMKAYRGVDGKIRIFRPDLNMIRMNQSAISSGLPTFDSNEMIKCMKRLLEVDQEWVPHSESSSLYLRPTLIGIDGTLGVQQSDSALLYTIMCPVGSYFEGDNDAVSLLADPAYTRAWPGGCGDKKLGSNYGPTIRVQSKANQRGRQQVLWLYGPERQITEVGTMNIFIFYKDEYGNKVLATPPLNGLILPGVTRQSILQVCEQWKEFRIEQRIITMTDIIQLEKSGRLLEMFGSGTACIVSPINSIEYEDQMIYIPTTQHKSPIYRRVREDLKAIQYGHIEHPWAQPID
ncbi:branched-chain-amino-acid aminotransferase, cytosolic [Anthonomus grandis grandis]|uniref:branched-chain-amino-acid aminotransferase, cytosolic n=1 Tax=Anthonomus grandis grandis TaxID=2921223 RepID=UPI002166639C|nr:branched-chain-amino-acid aminotransferase, cytosolic [Anthonomus grandis grandis]